MKIIFTGGGTIGHVAVNVALMPYFIANGWDVHYIGSKNGLEYDMVKKIQGVTFHSISTGKLRRYFDAKNFSDMFRVVKGVIESAKIINKISPDIVFSKGGFVSFPVVVAAKLNHTKIILHESDLTPGLANKMSLPFCDLILTTFKDTGKYIKSKNYKYIGAIVREKIKLGKKEKGIAICGLNDNKPILLAMGGSQGAQSINYTIRRNLIQILKYFNVIHICGKNNIDKKINYEGYRQYEFVNEELPDLISASDIVLSRAGSNAIFEFLQLKKPMLLVPLPRNKSRGDQIYNADYFKSKGYCEVLNDEIFSKSNNLITILLDIYNNSFKYISCMNQQDEIGSLNEVIEIIENMAIKKTNY